MRDTEFEFEYVRPEAPEGASINTAKLLAMGSFAGRMAMENRTNTNHADGRPESVAEHISMLSRTAIVLAPTMYPHLDMALVLQFAVVHDDPEAYVGDTPTDRITPEGRKEKEIREEAGVAQLLTEFEDIPLFTDLVQRYELQEEPEARFIKVLDKCMPHMTYFNNNGSTIRSVRTPDQIMDNAREMDAMLREKYIEFSELIDIRMELCELVVRHLFE